MASKPRQHQHGFCAPWKTGLAEGPSGVDKRASGIYVGLHCPMPVEVKVYSTFHPLQQSKYLGLLLGETAASIARHIVGALIAQSYLKAF